MDCQAGDVPRAPATRGGARLFRISSDRIRFTASYYSRTCTLS